MATTRAFKSGNRQAVRIPAEIAFEESQELTIARHGDGISIYPKRSGLKQALKSSSRCRFLRLSNPWNAFKCRSGIDIDSVAFLIDTNVVIDARDGLPSVLAKLLEHDGAVFVSGLSVAELQRGFHQEIPAAALRRLRLEKLLNNLPVVAFDQFCGAGLWRHSRHMRLGTRSRLRSLDRGACTQPRRHPRYQQRARFPRHSRFDRRELAV